MVQRVRVVQLEALARLGFHAERDLHVDRHVGGGVLERAVVVNQHDVHVAVDLQGEHHHRAVHRQGRGLHCVGVVVHAGALLESTGCNPSLGAVVHVVLRVFLLEVYPVTTFL